MLGRPALMTRHAGGVAMVDPLRVVRYYPRALTGDGGMTHAVRRWSESTAEAGYLAAIAHDGGLPPVEPNKVHWVDLPHIGPTYARVPRGLDRVLRRGDILVLHSGWTVANLSAGELAWSGRVPYVLESRGAYDPHIVRRKRAVKRLWWMMGEGRLVHRAAAMHVFFQEESRHLEALGYQGPTIVVPNGVDSPAEPPWRGGSGELLWLGRFDAEHKGLDLLVQAVGLLAPAERPRIRLQGPDRRGGRRRVKDLVRRAGLDKWIIIGPAVYGQSKRDLLTTCEGFLYPSRWDACPNAVLESAALGVPTLCGPYPLGTRLAAVAGAIQVDADPEAMADGLRRFGNRAEMSAMGTAGARLMREQFSWSHVAVQWIRQIRNALGER